MAPSPTVETLVGRGLERTVNNIHAPGTLACTVICGLVTLNICALRLYARLTAQKRLAADDWLFVAAALLFVLFDVFFGLSARYRGGSSGSDSRMLGVFSIVNDNLYVTCVLTLKLSILALYDSMFISRNFRRCLLAIAIYSAAWALAVLIVTNIRCVPLDFTWNPSISNGWCLAYNPFVMATTGLNIVGNLALLAVPVPMVLRLSPSKGKQRVVFLSFSAGAATCAIGIVRFALSLNGVTKTGQGSANLSFGITSTVELTFGLLCASLPTYSYFFPGYNIPGPTSNSRRYVMQGDTSNFRPRDQGSISTLITGGQTSAPRRSGIAVTDDFSRVSYTNVGGAWKRVANEDETALVPVKVNTGSHQHKGIGWTEQGEDTD